MRWFGLTVLLIAAVYVQMNSLWAQTPAAGNTATRPVAENEDWPHWRGPHNDNQPLIKHLAADLGKLTKAWEYKGLCDDKVNATWSSVVMVDDKLLTMGRSGKKDVLVCLNAKTGDLIWKKDYDAPGPAVQYGNGPRATPTIEGDKVYTFGCFGQVGCWDLADGKLNWMKNADTLGGKRPMWGYASTPLVWQGKVIVQIGGKSLAVALDAKTGDTVWTSAAGACGYAAPMIAHVEDKSVLVVFASDSIVGLDPDKGGKLWATPWPTSFGMNCSTPIQIGNRLLVCSSNYGEKTGGAGLFELSATGLKKVWTTVAWGPGHNDPVVKDGLIYAYSGQSLDDKGTLVCADLATGAPKWTTGQAGGPGTIVAVADKLLCLNNRGKLLLVEPTGEGFKQLSEFQALQAHPVWTTSVIVRGRLYVRFADVLICYEGIDVP